jgi:cell division protease FtsH
VAEDMFLGFIDTGALNDLERATKIAYAMVTYYGMSDKLPNVSYYDTSGESYGFTKPYSEQRARDIDAEVQSIVNGEYERARSILEQYAEGHHELAQLLQQREVIYTEDAERIFGPRKWLSRTDTILKQQSDDKGDKDEEKNDTDTDANADTGTMTTPPPFNK